MPKRSAIPAWLGPDITQMGKLSYDVDIGENESMLRLLRLGTRLMPDIHGTPDDSIPLTQALMFKQTGHRTRSWSSGLFRAPRMQVPMR